MNCDQVRARIDLCQDGETARDETASMEQHLVSCTACAAFAEQRETLRLRVRNAVRNVEAPAELGHNVQFELARGERRRGFPGWLPALIGVTAMLTIAAGVFYFWPAYGSFGRSSPVQFSDVVAPVMQIGLRQHVHCAVLREYPKDAPTLLDLAHAEGSNAGLVNAVDSHVPEGLRVVMAHRCSYEGRTYTHVIARGEGHIMSLLIAKREAGDTLGVGAKSPILSAGARKDSQNYSIAAFETSGYLVYLVSDLDPAQNLAAFQAMEQQVRAALI